MTTDNDRSKTARNDLAESFKETLNVQHILNLTSKLTRKDRHIAILDAAQSLVHEGYPVLAETLIVLVKKLMDESPAEAARRGRAQQTTEQKSAIGRQGAKVLWKGKESQVKEAFNLLPPGTYTVAEFATKTGVSYWLAREWCKAWALDGLISLHVGSRGRGNPWKFIKEADE